MILDFGSGYNPQKNCKTCDFTYSFGLDYVFDAQKYRVSCEAETFSKIYCRNVLHHVPDLERIFKEFARILKPHGQLIVIDANSSHFKQNVILDIVWYRYIFPRYDIFISSVYRDFEPFANTANLILKRRFLRKEKIYFEWLKL